MDSEEIMLQIKDTLVSLDLAERFFCCDLDKCLGECCIEGDAGAPVTNEEVKMLKKILPVVEPYITPRAKQVISDNGVAYVDEEGDLVTSIVDGKDCVFTCFEKNGTCLCAIEKAYRDGKIKDFRKPASCHLYPVRLTKYPSFTAVNYHRWKICRAAEVLGRKNEIRLYEFLKEPLTAYFGKEWYDELALACHIYLEEYNE